jgi:hypothetical protein
VKVHVRARPRHASPHHARPNHARPSRAYWRHAHKAVHAHTEQAHSVYTYTMCAHAVHACAYAVNTHDMHDASCMICPCLSKLCLSQKNEINALLIKFSKQITN